MSSSSTKDPHAVALGRRGGLIGGRSTSPALQAARRKNVAKARAGKAAKRAAKTDPQTA